MSSNKLRIEMITNSVSNAAFKNSKIILFPDAWEAASYLDSITGKNSSIYLTFKNTKDTDSYSYRKIYTSKGIDITKVIYNLIIKDGIFKFSEKYGLGVYTKNFKKINLNLFIIACIHLEIDDYCRACRACVCIPGYKDINKTDYRPIDKDEKIICSYERMIDYNIRFMYEMNYNETRSLWPISKF